MDQVAAGRIRRLEELYSDWNAKINVISRRDIPNLFVNHVLHSLSLAKIIPFSSTETVLDIGTGGGFPGIPLAILYPGVRFTLLDGTGKKIKVVGSIAKELQLANVEAVHSRAENFNGRFNYVISRAVSSFPRLVELSAGKLINDSTTSGIHGIYSLKGGDIKEEISAWQDHVTIYEIDKFFNEEYFKAKYVIFLPTRAISRK
jgi:16S rRNA (guanine527-N7)-methyltransferase